MKFIIMTYVMLIICLERLMSTNEVQSENPSDNDKLIQCKVCQEMFERDFDSENFIKDDQTQTSIINFLINPKIQISTDKEKIKSLSREISMQYFFKGAETQFDAKNTEELNKCKLSKQSNCIQFKLKLCDGILSLEESFCVSKMLKRIDDNMKRIVQENENKKMTSFLGGMNNNIVNTVSQPQIMNNNFFDLIKNQLSLPQALASPSQVENISFVEVNHTYPPPQPPVENLRKEAWQPPKNVLLDNFQSNIGDQLKEISVLSTYCIYSYNLIER